MKDVGRVRRKLEHPVRGGMAEVLAPSQHVVGDAWVTKRALAKCSVLADRDHARLARPLQPNGERRLEPTVPIGTVQLEPDRLGAAARVGRIHLENRRRHRPRAYAASSRAASPKRPCRRARFSTRPCACLPSAARPGAPGNGRGDIEQRGRLVLTPDPAERGRPVDCVRNDRPVERRARDAEPFEQRLVEPLNIGERVRLAATARDRGGPYAEKAERLALERGDRELARMEAIAQHEVGKGGDAAAFLEPQPEVVVLGLVEPIAIELAEHLCAHRDRRMGQLVPREEVELGTTRLPVDLAPDSSISTMPPPSRATSGCASR